MRTPTQSKHPRTPGSPPDPSARGPADRSREPSAADDLGAWSDARWAGLLDRIEHREPHVGLRFWAPPLWLEVTMSGPDSDEWPGAGVGNRPWDWQSLHGSDAVDRLVGAEAGDDEILGEVSRYTIENLILNATHEVGEWFRFDARRAFPPHRPVPAGSPMVSDGPQGNGEVYLAVSFAEPPNRPAVPLDAGQMTRLADAAAPWRFSYETAAELSFDSAGPLLSDPQDGSVAWAATWSADTVAALHSGSAEVQAAVIRDVHRLLVHLEADRACRAFHVDGRRPWRLTADRLGPIVSGGSGGHRPSPVSLSIRYSD